MWKEMEGHKMVENKDLKIAKELRIKHDTYMDAGAEGKAWEIQDKAKIILNDIKKGCGEMMYDPREGVFCDESGVCEDCREIIEVYGDFVW